MQLHPFQERAVERVVNSILNGDNILVSSPTGSGKTLLEVESMSRLEQFGLTVGMITSRNEIIESAYPKGERMGINLTNKLWTPIRFWNAIENKRVRIPQVVIVDEAHHSIAQSWNRFFEFPGVRVAGFTATPMRGVKQENPAWRSLFHQFYEAISIAQAIKQKLLANFYIIKDVIGILGEQQYNTDKKQAEAAQTQIMKKMSDIFDILTCLDMTKPTVFITPTTTAAVKVANYFEMRGIPMREILGTTPAKDRVDILNNLARNNCWVSAVNIMTEGVDVPEIARVVNLRPSVSPIPYVQGLGRGLRLLYPPGSSTPDLSLKSVCEFVDFTSNLFRFQSELANVMGLRMLEGTHVYYPDLDFEIPDEVAVPIVPDYINFHYTPSHPTDIKLTVNDEIIISKVGDTPSGAWGIRLIKDGESKVFVLRGGMWCEMLTQVHPVDYKVVIGAGSDIVLNLAAKLSRGFKQVTSDHITIGELLTFSLLRQIYPTRGVLDPTMQDAERDAQRLLTLIPAPKILEARANNN